MRLVSRLFWFDLHSEEMVLQLENFGLDTSSPSVVYMDVNVVPEQDAEASLASTTSALQGNVILILFHFISCFYWCIPQLGVLKFLLLFFSCCCS